MALQTARITAAYNYLVADKRRGRRPDWLQRGGFTDLLRLDRVELRRQLNKVRHVLVVFPPAPRPAH